MRLFTTEQKQEGEIEDIEVEFDEKATSFFTFKIPPEKLESEYCLKLFADKTISGGIPYEMDEPLPWYVWRYYHKRRVQWMRSEMLYETICHHAERLDFYERFGLEINLSNWFRICMIHLWMVLKRINLEGRISKQMPQELVDIFFKDVENRMIAGGVEGFALNKILKKGSKVYFNTLSAYDEAYVKGIESMADALKRNIFSPKYEISQEKLMELAKYMFREVEALEKQSGEKILRGELELGALPPSSTTTTTSSSTSSTMDSTKKEISIDDLPK